MNVETGQIYKTVEEIEAARKRGERLVELGDGEYQKVAGMNRKQRRAWAREHKQEKCDTANA